MKRERGRKILNGRSLLFLLLLFMVVPVQQGNAEEKINIGEVVVTATRYEEKSTNVPANVSVITRKDIEKSTAQNIPDLLRSETGVQVNNVAGNRRFFTVDVRGFGETAALNTLVLVDGRRTNQADLSGVDWMEIPLERVSRIEVIRGGRGSVLYGDNAAGGVINIITREGAEGFKAEGELAAGSFGTLKTDSYVSGSVKDFSVNLSGDYFKSDGFRKNSKTESKDLGANATYYIKDFMKIDFSSGYHKDHTGLPGALKESDYAGGASRNDSKHPDDFSDTQDYYIKFVPEIHFQGDNVFKVDASYRKRDFSTFSSGDFGNFRADSDIKTYALSPQVILKQNFDKIKNSLTAGVDYQKIDEGIVNTAVFFGSPSSANFTMTKENYGFYVHDEIGIGDSLRVSGGYRHDRAKFSFDQNAPGTPGSASLSTNSYTAGLNYTFFRKSYAYVSYSRSFRYPLFDELFSFFDSTLNTSFVPQTSNNYEVGARHYFSDDIFLHANVFRMDTDNEIVFNPVTYQNQNIDGKTRRDGVELSVSARAASCLTLRAGYSYLNATIKEGTFAGKNFPNVPRNKATADAVFQVTKEATIILNGIYVGERPFISDFNNEFTNQESYLIMNAKLRYKWKNFKVFVDINNLTNKEYSEYGVAAFAGFPGVPTEKAFYPSPKRNFLAGISIEF
ncbi:MAG TPA: TonB-dependent receptor [Thermodesulfovibrionales bacterium]|nr:TonB-dependent receptor [Thermodesulfovibrionales bacterium]